MSDYRTRNAVLAVDAEGTSGTEETLTVAADAVRAENPRWVPEHNVIQTAESTGSLDGAGPIVGRGFARLTADVLLKGSGTGGTAPEFGPLLRACGLAESLLAADIDETAQAGAAATITLHAGASATDDFYVGMVITTTGGAGSGQTRVISDYDGTTKVATVVPAWGTEPDVTTTFTIFANALYIPASTDLETATAYLWRRSASGANAHLAKLVGGAGNVSLALPVGEIGRMSFNLMGIIPGDPANVADPGDPTYDSVRPAPFKDADAYLGGSAVKFNALSLDLGNSVSMADDPSAENGYDVAAIGARRIAGNINPRLVLLSSRNAFADFTDGTERSLWVRYGGTAGNRVSVWCPKLRYTGDSHDDLGGIVVDSIPFEAVGEDTGVYLCLY